MPRKLWILHIALLVIAIGGMVSALTAKESTLVLRAGHPVNRYGLVVEQLRPDTLLIDGQPHFIAVNHPVTVGRCRLYQQSRLPDGVSVVSIRKDLAGTVIVNVGFALFILGGVILHRWVLWLLLLQVASRLLADSPLLQHAHWASMALVAIALAAMSLKYKEIRGYIWLAAGIFALVAAMQALHTHTGPMIPALQSRWLALHVAVVMISYAFFIVITILALKGQTPRRLLAAAVWLLGFGIITGAAWANESWGRYWSWDPKETMALITFLLYAIPLHVRRARPWLYLLPLPALAMTWFGIALFNSLHSY